MNTSETTRFVDEDAPTTIDHTVCIVADPIRSQRPRARFDLRLRRMSKRWSWIFGVALGVLVVAGTFGAFLRQRTLSTELQRRLALLEREYEANRSETSRGSQAPTVTPPRSRSFEVAELSRKELEAHGVDALVDRNFAVALRHYQALSESAPEETVFVDFVSVLRGKSKCASPSNRELIACP